LQTTNDYRDNYTETPRLKWDAAAAKEIAKLLNKKTAAGAAEIALTGIYDEAAAKWRRSCQQTTFTTAAPYAPAA